MMRIYGFILLGGLFLQSCAGGTNPEGKGNAETVADASSAGKTAGSGGAFGLPAAGDNAGSADGVKRYGMVTRLKPDRVDYYKELHAAAWPGVLAKIEESNIRNYSIYLKKIDDTYFLFSYFEYTGSDFAADMQKMAADSTTQRWWRETDPTQLPLPEAAAAGGIWTPMEEVFHTP